MFPGIQSQNNTHCGSLLGAMNLSDPQFMTGELDTNIQVRKQEKY